MRVVVVEHHGPRQRTFEGPPEEVRADLQQAYPSLLVDFGPHADPSALVRSLDSHQAFTAFVVSGDVPLDKSEGEEAADHPVTAAMLGADPERDRWLDAASFLAGRPADVSLYRRHLRALDGDHARAALLAVGLDQERHIAPLRAAVEAVGALHKATEDRPVRLGDVVPLQPEGQPFADEVKRAVETDGVHRVKLGGKHSNGAMIVFDRESAKRLILKPGSGAPSPAAGVAEVPASQTAREAAFSAVARLWGLGDYVPECHELLADGHVYAALRMLGLSWRTMDQLRREDPVLPGRALAPYARDGLLHRLAVLDLVLGNVDRHAGNILMRGDKFSLIDHGSAFAGRDFRPATDPDTFTPAYLRAAVPDFDAMDPDRKLRAMPRLDHHRAAELGAWLGGLDAEATASLLRRFGVDPAPCLHRLDALRGMTLGMAPDLAVDAAWVLP